MTYGHTSTLVTKQSRSVRTATAVIAAALSVPLAHAQQPTDALPVYDATQVAFDGYTVVKRIWVDGWRSAFGVRGHRELADARRAVIDEAARAGADGVVNLACMSRTDGFLNPSGYYCYGYAIKVKKP